MCRYSGRPYKDTYACFACRTGFKRRLDKDLLPEQLHAERPAKCPNCGLAAINLGKDLKLPRKTQAEKWTALEYLANNQFNFFTCGCSGIGFVPQSLEEAYQLVRQQRTPSAGELLLGKISG